MIHLSRLIQALCNACQAGFPQTYPQFDGYNFSRQSPESTAKTRAYNLPTNYPQAYQQIYPQSPDQPCGEKHAGMARAPGQENGSTHRDQNLIPGLYRTYTVFIPGLYAACALLIDMLLHMLIHKHGRAATLIPWREIVVPG